MCAALFRSSVLSLLVTALLIWADRCSGAEADAAAPDVVNLSSEEPDTSEPSAGIKLLCREILRQAVLMSARDEAGLATRDMTLREDAVSGAPTFRALTARNKSKYYRVKLYAPNAPDKPVFEKRLTVPDIKTDLVDYVGLVTAAEKLSREELGKFWQKQKFQAQPNRIDAEGALPEDFARQLDEMNCFSQFAAVRALHAHHRTEGESPETLAGLARGYANLGQLVLLHWNASHTAYQSRSLLYAQRLVARQPDSAFALWNRAYALAMSGMHQAALDDMKAAELLAAKAPTAPGNSRPEWVDLIDGLCRYSFEELFDAAKNGKQPQQLAWLCAYLTVEPGKDADDLRLSTGFEALKASPECLRVSNSMSLNSGVSTGHRTTIAGAMALRANWRARLLEMPNLPQTLLAAARELPQSTSEFAPGFGEGADIAALLADAPKLVQSAVTAGAQDRGEPSTAALGRLLEDMCFLELAQRQDFLKFSLGVPVRDFCRHAEGLFPKHPYVSFIQSGPLDQKRDGEKFWKLFENLDVVDADTSQYLLMKATWDSPLQKERLQGEEAFARALTHSDHAAYAFTYCLQFANKDSQKRTRAELLSVISPYCPLGVATLIRMDWKKNAEEQASELEKKYARQPIVLAQLARGYLKQKRDDDAQRVLQVYLEQSPDAWAFEDLADLYLKKGDVAKWKATLDECLTHTDYGLTHARVQVKAARYLMDQKKWAEAKPYAAAAAESGAAWAMFCAADCYEGLGEWDNSEAQVQFVSSRYANSRPEWYFWCRRTGHGDLNGARKLAGPYFDQLKTKATPDWIAIGWYSVLENDQEGAIAAFRQLVDATGTPYYGMQLVMLYDELGRKPERDAALAELLRNGAESKQHPNRITVQLAKAMQDAILHDGDGLDVNTIDAVVADASPEDSLEAAQFIAPYLVRHGKLEQGLRYYAICEEQPSKLLSNTAARTKLRELKSKPQ